MALDANPSSLSCEWCGATAARLGVSLTRDDDGDPACPSGFGCKASEAFDLPPASGPMERACEAEARLGVRSYDLTRAAARLGLWQLGARRRPTAETAQRLPASTWDAIRRTMRLRGAATEGAPRCSLPGCTAPGARSFASTPAEVRGLCEGHRGWVWQMRYRRGISVAEAAAQAHELAAARAAGGRRRVRRHAGLLVSDHATRLRVSLRLMREALLAAGLLGQGRGRAQPIPVEVVDRAIAEWRRAHPGRGKPRKTTPTRRRYSDAAVAEVKRALLDGSTVYAVAKKRGIARNVVKRIARGETYAHVAPAPGGAR